MLMTILITFRWEDRKVWKAITHASSLARLMKMDVNR